MDIQQLAGHGRTISPSGQPAAKPAPAGATGEPDSPSSIQAAAHNAQLTQAVREINQTVQAAARDLEFSVDPETRATVVRVIDHASGEVIRQIPAEETLEIARSLDRLQGLLLKQKV